MNHAFTLEDIREITKSYEEPKKAIGILIARPNIEMVRQEIIPDINYFYYRSGKFIDFFLPGYGAYWYGHYPDAENVCKVDGVDWSYSDKMFCNFIEELEQLSRWKYSGETELIIINSQNGTLDLTNTLSIWIDAAIKDGAVYSARNLIEELIRLSKSEIDTVKIRESILLKSMGSFITDGIFEKLPFSSGKNLKKTRHFINRNISK